MFTPEQSARYERAAHAMQSGVALDQQFGSPDGTPKHLRVGINSALVETSALGGLLVAKGIVTEEEYAEAIVTAMEREVASYEQRLKAKTGQDITLG
jgi:hypothetical protein